MKAILDDATDKWGVKINRVELQDIHPPRDIKDAMEKQMRAERDLRAAILEAEGLKQSKILEAEGFKEAQINKAEGEKKAKVLIAETKKRTSRRSRGAGHLSFDDFEPHEQALLTLTAREKGLSIPDLMSEAVREYLAQNVKIQVVRNESEA